MHRTRAKATFALVKGPFGAHTIRPSVRRSWSTVAGSERYIGAMSDQGLLTAHERREVILRAVAAQLSTAEEHWRVAGDHVRGPGTVAVVLGDGCDEGSPQHVELGIALNVNRPDAPVVWDCAVGFSRDEREAITHAVEIWWAVEPNCSRSSRRR